MSGQHPHPEALYYHIAGDACAAGLLERDEFKRKQLVATAMVFSALCLEVFIKLPTLGVDRSKSTWLVSVFDQMGDDPTEPGYLLPQPGDVWDFIGQIGTWVRDVKRKGIPE